MIFNEVITDIYLMDNPRITVKYVTGDVLDLKVDDISMGTIVYSNGSVFYKDFMAVGNRDIARREYFLSKVIYERILRLKEPHSSRRTNIYKITGIRK